MRPALLSGQWRDLVVVTWRVDPACLEPLLPAGVDLDTWEGHGLISLVGLTFLGITALGIPVPGLQVFAQVNVRFYVRRTTHGEVRHGSCFLAEIAPTPLLAAGARLALHEPFVARDTCVVDRRRPDGRHLTYAWRDPEWNHVRAVIGATTRPEAGPGSLETFVLQRCWGYTPQRDGTTIEYAVRHPMWRTRAVHDLEIAMRWPGGRVPQDVASRLAAPPAFVLFAEGSAMEMHRPARLPLAAPRRTGLAQLPAPRV